MRNVTLGILFAASFALGAMPEAAVAKTQQAAYYIPPEPKSEADCRAGQWACYRSCFRDSGESIWLPACLMLCDHHFNSCIGTPGL